jgi:hypothetical protein
VVSVLLGGLFLAEQVTINVVIGTLVVFVGIALTQQRLRLPGTGRTQVRPAAGDMPSLAVTESGPRGSRAQPDETSGQ